MTSILTPIHTSQLESYAISLEELLALDPKDAGDFDAWITHFSDISAAIDETCQRGFVKEAQNLADEEARILHSEIRETYERRLEPLLASLRTKTRGLLGKYQHLRPAYQSLSRKWQRVTPATPRACDLYQEEHALLGEYCRLLSSLTIAAGGREFGIREARSEQFGDDASIRETAEREFSLWLETHDEKIQTLFSRILEVRHEIAHVSGYENFIHYF